MSAYLPALQIILPLVSAPFCLILRKTNAVWLFTFIISLAAFVISSIVLYRVYQHGVITLAPGGWLAMSGIALHIDHLSAYALIGITAISSAILLAANPISAERSVLNGHVRLYVCYLICLAGLSGMIVSADLVSIFLFLEASIFAACFMISLGSDRRAGMAAFRYFVLQMLGSVLILAGMLFLYADTGSINMQVIALQLSVLSGSGSLSIAYDLLVIGLCLKLALFPFHIWLPQVYRFAPPAVTALLATAVLQVVGYLMLRFTALFFAGEFTAANLPILNLLIAVSLAAVILASITAIFQDDMKLLLAYATIAQAGYLVLGFSLNHPAGFSASIIQLFNHALISGTLFIALMALIYRTGNSAIDAIAGLGKHMPWTMSALILAGLSLAGIPPTAGFVGKWHLLIAAFDKDWWPVAVLVLIGSILTLVYLWKIIESAYFRPAASRHREAPACFLAPLWILAVSNIYFGIDTRLTAGTGRFIAEGIFGISQ